MSNGEDLWTRWIAAALAGLIGVVYVYCQRVSARLGLHQVDTTVHPPPQWLQAEFKAIHEKFGAMDSRMNELRDDIHALERTMRNGNKT